MGHGGARPGLLYLVAVVLFCYQPLVTSAQHPDDPDYPDPRGFTYPEERRSESSPPDSLPEFDGTSAFTFLYKQVEMGSRIPGSKAHERARKAFVDWFEVCGGRVDVRRFKGELPLGDAEDAPRKEITGYNIVADFGPRAETPTLLFGAHYDTRPWPAEGEPLDTANIAPPGANDGASGVSVLLELARLFAVQPPERPVQLVLFDMNNSGTAGRADLFCQGSRHFARHHVGNSPRGTVILDLVGREDAEFPVEGYSLSHAQAWTEEVLRFAEAAGVEVLLNTPGPSLLEDQLPLLHAGFAACLLSDPNDPDRNTSRDVPAACSADALARVGRLLTWMVYHVEKDEKEGQR